MLKTSFPKLPLTLLLLVLSMLLSAAELPSVKYLFLFIGDGLSLPQRALAGEFCRQTGAPAPALNELPFRTATTTWSADSGITDSAAAGTALACGAKTANGRLGVDAEGNRLTSVAEVARDSGRKVGIVSSVTLNHATPAAFYGHNPGRGNAYALGLELIDSGFDYFGGGGLDRHDHREAPEYRGDLFELARQRGYTVARDPAAIRALKPGTRALACAAGGALPYAIDRRSGELTLADFTAQAIAQLDQSGGFFLMVEGGRIDQACHANDPGTALREVLDFDRAIQVALDFARRHPQETLLVVTGDHETGGLTLGYGGTGYQSHLDRLRHQRASGDALRSRLRERSAQPNFTFADAQALLAEELGFARPGAKTPDGAITLTSEEWAQLQAAFERAFPGGKAGDGGALVAEALQLLSHHASLAWSTGAHTALPVWTTAVGPGAGAVARTGDNAELGRLLKTLMAEPVRNGR